MNLIQNEWFFHEKRASELEFVEFVELTYR